MPNLLIVRDVARPPASFLSLTGVPGDNTLLANALADPTRGFMAIRTGTVVSLDHPFALYPAVLSGTFTVDTTSLRAGCTARVVLGPSAGTPVLDPGVFKSGDSLAPTRSGNVEYLFLVDYAGATVQYIITTIV